MFFSTPCNFIRCDMHVQSMCWNLKYWYFFPIFYNLGSSRFVFSLFYVPFWTTRISFVTDQLWYLFIVWVCHFVSQKNLQKMCSWSKENFVIFLGPYLCFIWNHLKMMHWLKLYKSNWTFNSQPQAVLFWKLFHILLCLWKIHSLPLYYC